MNYRRFVVPVVTLADGTAQAYTPSLSGEIVAIHYVKDGSNAFSNGVGVTLSLEATAQGLWTQANVNASASVAPTQPVHDQVGVAALFAAGGTAIRRPIVMADDRVSIAIASGGNAKNGSFIVVVQ